MSGESLTKDQLREQLIANGIQLPPATAKKSVYVELYNNNIRNSHGHFSSDDDVHADSSSGRRTKKTSGVSSTVKSTIREAEENNGTGSSNSNIQEEVQAILKPDTSRWRFGKYMPSFWCSEAEHKGTSFTKDEKRVIKQAFELGASDNLDNLTNSQIAAKLRQLGVKPGPIGQTTRNVYLKKLAKLLTASSEEKAAPDEKYSDDEKEDPVPTVPVTRSSSRRRTLVADNPPQVSTRRSSSSGYNKRRSVAQTTLNENISLTQPTIGSATRRRPLRKTTNIPKTPERTEKLQQQVQQETEQDGPAKPEEAAQSTSDERWVPVWAQIVITLILVAFFYLVLQYLEGNPPLPSLPGNNAKQ